MQRLTVRYGILILLCGLFFTYFNEISAQTLSNWRKETSALDSLQQMKFPDSIVVLSESLTLMDKAGNPIDKSLYNFDESTRTITFYKPLKDSFQLTFRAMPSAFTAPKFNKDRALMGDINQLTGEQILGGAYTYNPYRTNTNQIGNLDMNGLDYSGAFSRGLSVGNNQSLVQDANFNLQLAGKLGDIEITAAITDNNIPIQPNGNTQQLQDFDKVFIQFKLDNQSLIAGDYNLTNYKQSYFAKYNRRLQGGQLNNQFRIGDNKQLNTSVSFALARGKFAKNNIQGQEGNQGPYKLKGNNGETYIIIIAGTEKVYIDGQLLTRGADMDYVIDYNLGEIRFTNKRMITKDKRIQVDFTYNDLNYTRTLYDIQTQFKVNKTTIRFQHFSEQDAKNQSTQSIMNDTTRQLLYDVGDSIQWAYTSGIRPFIIEENTNPLRYKLIDTIVNGIHYDSVLVYAPNDTFLALYTAQFSLVSSGGNYVRLQNGINGAVYEWIAPDLNGQSRGTHAPIALVVAPIKQQLTTLGVNTNVGKNGVFDAEIALSNNDINTFSKKGNEDNMGLAARLNYGHQWRVFSAKKIEEKQDTASNKNDTLMPNSLSQKIENINNLNPNNLGTLIKFRSYYEFAQKRFRSLDPYRDREFARDWNTTNLDTTSEHWIGLSVGIENKYIRQLSYESSMLLKDSIYNGFRQNAVADFMLFKNLRINANLNYLMNEGVLQKANYMRPKMSLSYTLPKLNYLEFGASWEREKNTIKSISTDTLVASSFYFDILKAYAQMPMSNSWRANASYLYRSDYLPFADSFSVHTVANEANLGAKWEGKSMQTLEFNFTYRNLDVLNADTMAANIEPQNTYLGRAEYNAQWKKGFIRANTIYEIGAGQQQKVEYNYVQTDAGLGTYIWIDRNEDGLAQQNEFEVATFQDQANFIRVSVLSNEYIRTQNVNFSQSLEITPKTLFARNVKKLEERPFLKFITRLSTRSLFKIERKVFAENAKQIFNPFLLKLEDNSLVSFSSQIQNTLYFNRSMPNFNMEFSQYDTRNKNLLSTGFESRAKSEYTFVYRVKLWKNLMFNHTSNFGQNSNNSEFFADRNYSINYYSTSPALNIIRGTNLRFILKYNYKQQINQIGNEEKATANTMSIEANYNKLQSWNLRAQFSFVKIDFTGAENTAIAYAMNEGLNKGENYLWIVGIDKNIAQNIQFSFSYEGRKTGESKIVHVGRAQIRATF